MANQLCFHCFKVKGDYDVCPYCGHIENTKAEQVYQLAPGTILHDRYIMGTSIGIGGFGITYKAFDSALGVVVAIKEFYPAGLVNRGEGEKKVGIFSGDKEAEFKRQLVRFLEEARNIAAFSKEQDIVNVFDFFEENQTAYIIMEYVDAPLLKDRLKQGPLSQEEASAYMLAVLTALEKVHEKGIIHKDVSPDNIFLTGPNSIKLFDFGAAKFQKTQSGRSEAIVVKAGYTPPEQYKLNDVQGKFTDIYAAGAIFYEMLTGVRPIDSLDRVVRDELKRPSAYGYGISENLERIVLKAMALQPRLRFKTAGQFKAAIATGEKVELPEENIKRQRRMRQLLAVGVAAVIIIAGGTLVLSQTVFSGKGKIDPSRIESENLSIWLSAEDQEEGEQVAQTLLESVEREYDQLAVDVTVVASQDYADRIEQALAQGNLPDVFCVDGIRDLAGNEQYCAEMSSLLHTMGVSSYLYLEQIEADGKVFALPTALQVGAAYINEEKTEELPGSVTLDELMQKGDALAYADEEDVLVRFQDKKESVCWLAGDLSELDDVQAVTVKAVPSTEFAVIPILEEGRLIGNLKHWYGVKKSGDKNREIAGMVLVSLLLSDGMQSAAYMDNVEGLPLNRTVLDSYKENKMTTYLSFLKEYDLEDVQLYDGENMAQLLRQEAKNAAQLSD